MVFMSETIHLHLL